MGSGTDAFATLLVVGIAAFLLISYVSQYGLPWGGTNIDLTKKWELNISVEPAIFVDAPSVQPSGRLTVDQFKAVTVNATGTNSWTFQCWIFDNVTVGESPSITIPSQAVNTSHTLKAVFIARVTAFEIYPAKTFVRGSQNAFTLYFKNNENVEISDVRLRLNDPSGVFASFYIHYTWLQSSSGGSSPTFTYYHRGTTCLNVFMSSPIKFNPWRTGAVNSDVGNVPAKATLEFYCGNGYYPSDALKVSSTIAPGTYHLSWSVQFSIISGVFVSPPELNKIPWDVTILG